METVLSDKDSVVLNATASGNLPLLPFDRSLAIGYKTVGSLTEALAFISLGNELMQHSLDQYGNTEGITRLSTHPGLLKTDLHRGQGLLFNILESIEVVLEAGIRQVSFLASAISRSSFHGK